MLTLKKIIFISFSLQLLTKCRTKDYCSADFCNNSKQHTLCKYKLPEHSSDCLSYERTIISLTDRRLILDKLNNRRNKVAAGEIRSLPPAAGMMKLEWNTELELSAQRWADQCVRHDVPDLKDSCRDLADTPVGQNIATVQGDSPGLTPLALVDVWYMELLKFDSSVISRYVPSSEVGESHYDYFTQLVWEDTVEVGCGGVKFQERLDAVKYRTIYRLVCNFAPAGNRRNKTVYSCGAPCSACPDGVCDHDYKSLCDHKSSSDDGYTEKDVYDEAQSVQPNTVSDNTTNVSAILEPILGAISISNLDTSSDITFDYFPHLYDPNPKILRESITAMTKADTNKEALLDDFIELLKKKLSKDPAVKDLLSTISTDDARLSDISFNDENVAAFVSRIYSKNVLTTTLKTTPKDYVNSTLLVDLIEAVIFRSNEKSPSTEVYQHDIQTLPLVKPVKVQAELAEVKQNKEFTGHYFFPEEEDESTSEITESYYDTNFAQSDVEMEIEHLKMSSITRDFLDDIFESDTSTEKIDTIFFNKKRKDLKDVKKRKLRQISRKQSINYESHDQSTKLSKSYRSAFYKSIENKKYVSYKVLLQKIATDLRKLKLNEIFPCTRNRSLKLLCQPLLVIFGSLLLYLININYNNN